MDRQLFLSFFLILLILVLNGAYALMPLADYLRYPGKKTSLLCLGMLLPVIIAFSLIGAMTGIAVKWIFLISLIPAFAIHMFLTTSDVMRRLYCFFNATMVSGNSLLYGMILGAPLESDNSFATLDPEVCLVCIAIMLLLGVLYYRTLSVKIRYLISSDAMEFDYRLALCITVTVSALFFWVMPRYVDVVMTGRTRMAILVFLMLGPAAFLLVYHSMWRVAVKITENAVLRESNELRGLEQKRYRELRQYMDETRTMRHDFRQHLLVMDGYARSGEIEKLKNYISQFTGTFNDYRAPIAANPALDAVATHYEAIAEEQGTHIKWIIGLPEELPLPESDFIAIFGNLVENALIAVRELPEEERTVHVTARMLTDAMLGLTVRNPYAGTIKLNKKGLPRTDKAGHGIGLTSVSAVAGRYNGTLDISTDDGIFSASVLLCL